MCETLHPLNDLHAKCCKHWFFWGDFRPHFGTYQAVYQPQLDECWLYVLKSWRFISINTDFRVCLMASIAWSWWPVDIATTRNYAARKCLLQSSHIHSSGVACGTVLLKPHSLQVVFFNSRQKVSYHMYITLGQFMHHSHVSTTLWMVSWPQLLFELDIIWMYIRLNNAQVYQYL